MVPHVYINKYKTASTYSEELNLYDYRYRESFDKIPFHDKKQTNNNKNNNNKT